MAAVSNRPVEVPVVPRGSDPAGDSVPRPESVSSGAVRPLQGRIQEKSCISSIWEKTQDVFMRVIRWFVDALNCIFKINDVTIPAVETSSQKAVRYLQDLEQAEGGSEIRRCAYNILITYPDSSMSYATYRENYDLVARKLGHEFPGSVEALKELVDQDAAAAAEQAAKGIEDGDAGAV